VDVGVPLYDDACDRLRRQLELIADGERVPLIEIGQLTFQQHQHVREIRASLELPDVESPAIVYIGHHHFASRRAQGYTISDMVKQISACTDADAQVMLFRRMTMMRACSLRADGYGNWVRDDGIFELTRRKPRIELFSVIPRGDRVSPLQKQQSPRTGL
jgi:hypothetical protein